MKIKYKGPVSGYEKKAAEAARISSRMQNALVNQKESREEKTAEANAAETAGNIYTDLSVRWALNVKEHEDIKSLILTPGSSIKSKTDTDDRVKVSHPGKQYKGGREKKESYKKQIENRGREFARERYREEEGVGDRRKAASNPGLWPRFLRKRQNRSNMLLAIAMSVSLICVMLMCFTGAVLASPYGIFLSHEAGDGQNINSAVSEINTAFYGKIDRIRRENQYDIFELCSDNGIYGVAWRDVLPVYAVMVSTEYGLDAVTVDDTKKQILTEIAERMTDLNYSVTESLVETMPDEEGAEDSLPVKTLTVNITHEDISGYAESLDLDVSQMSLLEEICRPEYDGMWQNLAGAYMSAETDVLIRTSHIYQGLFMWPLPVDGNLTSGFGMRNDPFTGEQRFHGGTDIAAAEGTPILASADGTVIIANAYDPWGGGYGYYVIIDHGGGYSTLYGHCLGICVYEGMSVSRGDIIGYVGSTGNSTGNHLHFEVRYLEAREDPMIHFSD